MKRPLLLGLAALVLTACSKSEPTPAESPAQPPAAAQAPAPAVPAPAPAPAQGPSFDCNQASSDAETQVCNDAELSALDRRLAELYKAAQTSPDELDIAAEQRGWIKGRDACWQAVDARRCLVESYQTRIVELQIATTPGPGPAPVNFVCEGSDKPLAVTYYNEIEPNAALIRLGQDQAIAFLAPAASGARYTREGVEFWEHQGEATLAFYGTRLSCRKPA
ncbi:MliC family protein [Stenotrophomonas sp. PS02289]|uniref:MliC family protein n=1 Tax=Stenotrophomonas sp. PS02289 TaxID=2991422 RepID=UPI00249C1A0D|nr:MliC family protein [Stenotrophomonas sp. PS02289]